jgi:hypothetical protein
VQEAATGFALQALALSTAVGCVGWLLDRVIGRRLARWIDPT